MAGGFGQYLRDTKTELRHVAWPTRTQTIVYAILVAMISVGVALYLGLFDVIFTGGLSRLITTLPSFTSTPAAQTSPFTVPQGTTGSMDSVGSPQASSPQTGTTPAPQQ